MYAVVEIGGKQYKVSPDQYVYVPKMEGEKGTKITLRQALLVGEDGNKKEEKVGAPFLEGVSVSGTILEHAKGDKITVFKKKRRKGYAVKRGHRQQYTKILIESISGL